MKKFYAVIIFLLVSQFVVWGQKSNNPIMIKFNFKTKIFETDIDDNFKSIRKGNFYQIIITDINKNLYDIDLSGKDSFIVSNVSLPTFGSIGIDAISSVISSIKNVTSASAVEIQKELVSEIDKQKLLEDKLITLADEIRSGSKPNFVAKNTLLDYKEIKKFKKITKTKDENKFYNKYIYLEKKRADIIAEIAKLKEKLKIEQDSDKNKIIEKINSQHDQLKKISMSNSNKILLPLDSFLLKMNIQPLKYFMDNNALLPCISGDPNLCDYVKFIEEYRTKLINAKSGTHKIKIDLDDYIKSWPDGLNLMKKDSTLKVGYSTFESQIDKIIAALDKALDQINHEKVTTFFKSIIYLENSKSGEWISMPKQHLGDISSFKISITPKNTEFGLSSYSGEYSFPIKKSYIGVSAGIYYAPWFASERYSVLETVSSGSSVFKILKEEDEKGEIGLLSLLHFGSKIAGADWLGIHGSVGPAMSISSATRPRLCIGPGVSIGSIKNMVTFDILGMFGFVDKKSNTFVEGQEYTSKPAQITISKLTRSVAFSMGYIYKF